MQLTSDSKYNRPENKCKTFLIQYQEKTSLENHFSNTLFKKPAFQDFYYIFYLLLSKRFALIDMMPFLKTTSAARTRCVLCDKNRMVPHGRLLAVVSRIRIRKPPHNELACVLKNSRYTLPPEILCFFTA
jgi:hypothetical protein